MTTKTQPAKTRRSRRRAPPSLTVADPLWFKDAVIYQLHVRAFHDASGDGIGDFRGLAKKLDYIQDLGVTAIWLLPFFPSPLRDDGYDIADYTRINPAYGSLRDFKDFLKEAATRDLRVITELVMNHTSDQHAWFQKSRRAKPGDKWRDFYVWSDTGEKYREARIIFQDFETSNWTWDPVAQAYFWHRFYHHQPDLNFDNPEVHAAMLEVIDFWLEMGVDGVRLDAVPYLYEREGTNCENLPETHEFLKQLRRHVDAKYADKMLLAEANQWPEDAAAYFGQGDQCHMNFNFPLMPRLFMSIEREDRFPIIDILEQTPAIPENCQWGIFLRNHDELTLEMVTDEERDYMYRAYADDPRARVNLGIRRRLAPLLRDDRRKMELMNGLLLSLPGTPIIYYGDEIRMGDNIYLGDRDGVRTPMQWSDDRNAGFSRANPQRLFLPVIIDAPYHYASRNVEVEQSRPHSMLWWMRRIIGLRKNHPAFGRGTLEFLTPENPKVLSFLRQTEDETVLVVANLSRHAQCVELDLSRFRGQIPVEIFGQVRFPAIGELPYFLTMGTFAFYWFQLQWRHAEADAAPTELPTCRVTRQWDQLLEGRNASRLEAALPAYLRRSRWFAGKARHIQRTRIVDVLTIHDVPQLTKAVKSTTRIVADGLPATRILLVQVEYLEGEPDTYALPVVFSQGPQTDGILGDRPHAGIAVVKRVEDDVEATLCDTTRETEFWLLLFDALGRRRTIPGRRGTLQPLPTKMFARLKRGSPLPSGGAPATNGAALAGWDVHLHDGEQSNTSALMGGRLICKLFRRLGEGENPDMEIGRFLTEQAELACVPRIAGGLEYVAADGTRYTLALWQELVANEGDAWVHTQDELGRFLERVESELGGSSPGDELQPAGAIVRLADQPIPAAAQELIGPSLQSVSLLGQRTAELHLALASGTDSAFAPEPFTKLYQRGIYQSLRAQARNVVGLLRKQRSSLPEAACEAADRLLQAEPQLLQVYSRINAQRIEAQRTRCHGDYHLGQVLFTGKDYVIIDFEGEPDRPISQRRIKTSPLRDVAGMIRSFHYATHAAASMSLLRGEQSRTGITNAPWLEVWYRWCSATYLQSYLSCASQGTFLPTDREQLTVLLDTYLLEKAIYELGYELNNRPDWVRIPLEGILSLLDENT